MHLEAHGQARRTRIPALALAIITSAAMPARALAIQPVVLAPTWQAAAQTGSTSESPQPAQAPVRVSTVGDTLHGAVGGVAVDRLGNVYVADFANTVWRFSHWGTMEVFATGLYGASGNAIDSQGNLLQSNFLANTVSRIDRNGAVTRFADGFNGPVGIAVTPADSLVVCNCGANTLSKVTPDGEVATFAESPLFNCPNGITRHPDGHYFVANFSDGRVLQVSAAGEVTEYATIPGGGNGHVVFAAGDLYVTALRANRIFRIDAEGNISPFAGVGPLRSADGEAEQAMFSTPNGIAYDPVRDRLYTNDYLVPWLQRNLVEPLSLLRKLQLPSLTERFNAALQAGGAEAAMAAHRAYKASRPGRFTELEVNALGYAHLQAGRIEAAIAAFTLNTEDYPNSFNTWDSLGEAMAAAGRKEEAIRYYEKSLELNPANTNATEMIKRLRGG